MIRIKLIGGTYDQRVVEISEEVFNSGYFEIYDELKDNLFSECWEGGVPQMLKMSVLVYTMSVDNIYRWRLKE